MSVFEDQLQEDLASMFNCAEPRKFLTVLLQLQKLGGSLIREGFRQMLSS